LLFGSSAIGGVVNVIDSRIPRRAPEGGVHFDGVAGYGSAANERSAGGRLDLGLGSNFVLHADGTYSKSGNLDTGGFILAPALRSEAASSDEPEIQELSALKGKIPNSAARTWEIAGGLAWIGSNAQFGASISRFDSLYGVPVRYATTEEGEEEETEDARVKGELGEGPEEVRLDVKQTRYDVRGEVSPETGFLDAVRFRGGHADYKHNELEDTGEIGTTFTSKGTEARLELVQRERNGWKGAIGAQYYDRSLNIVGEEKFLPRNKTRQFGIFTVQSFDLGAFRAEAGGRVEFTRQRADADADLGTLAARRSFTAVSGSMGGAYEIATGVRIGINASYSQRAPSAEELFSNGPHAGTQAFEIGNPNFGKEKSTGLELTLRADTGPFKLSGSLYQSWFKGFIYEQPDGTEQDDLPVFTFLQDDARYFGAELEAEAEVAKIGDATISIDLVTDFTRAKIKVPGPDSNAPRIPAFRFLNGVSVEAEKWGVRAEVERVTGQNKIAAFETRTPGYTLVNASVTLRPFGPDTDATLVLSANNIFDVTARRHASFLKDYSPLAGRDIRVALQFGF
ncbi:MAG: hypothetical protein RL481_264, partial [Pseudomonadota bacterium]